MLLSVATGIIGMLLGIIGFFLTGFHKQVATMAEAITQLKLSVASFSGSASNLSAQLHELSREVHGLRTVNERFARLEGRVDALERPAG
jgi:hypothetical protein